MSDSTPPNLAPGLKLDRYELLFPLAQGGMAQVWMARLTGKHGFEKLVVIKTILAQHADDASFQSMFLDEARIIAGIRHPNVAEILDLGEYHELLYIVLEWVEGDSLAVVRRILHQRDEGFPLAHALQIVADACAGLHAAHEVRDASGKLRGVVHRDVSPANILLSASGGVKLIDFGVAIAVDRMSESTSGGMIKGKLAYMAPEQALGKAVDRRADLWALGITLYQLCGGRSPYKGSNELETLHLLTKGDPPPKLPHVPDRVWEVIARALRYDPEERYRTADVMRRAIESTLLGLSRPVTGADLGVFARKYLGPRVESLRKLTSRALEAAEQRAHIAVELSSAAETSTTDSYVLPRPTLANEEAPTLPPPNEAASASSSKVIATASLEPSPEPRKRKPAARIATLAGAVVAAAAIVWTAFAALHSRAIRTASPQPSAPPVVAAAPAKPPAAPAELPSAEPSATASAEPSSAASVATTAKHSATTRTKRATEKRTESANKKDGVLDVFLDRR